MLLLLKLLKWLGSLILCIGIIVGLCFWIDDPVWMSSEWITEADENGTVGEIIEEDVARWETRDHSKDSKGDILGYKIECFAYPGVKWIKQYHLLILLYALMLQGGVFTCISMSFTSPFSIFVNLMVGAAIGAVYALLTVVVLFIIAGGIGSLITLGGGGLLLSLLPRV